ncbi:MAG: sugar phosphate isomerase/epimerase [Ruminococcaceae bacterium]|nr:sugar phosphate isomerase/epimerase [Oscillospiraceae bacterium]
MENTKKYPVGLQLYSVRSDLARDFEGTLKAVSEMGYDGVEFAGLYGNSPKTVKELCEKYGLAPISAHIPLAEMLEDPEGTFAAYSEIGCKYAAVPYITVEDRPLQKNYDNTVENIKVLGEKAKKYGIQLMYHNHDFEFVRMADGSYGYDDMFSRIPAELLTAEIDVCWVNVAGEDPCDYLVKYADRIPVVHLKDFVMSGKKAGNLYNLIGMEEAEKADEDAFAFRPVGYGAQDIPAIIASLEGSVCQWLIVEQDEPSLNKSRLECAKLSRDYLKTIGI